MSLKCIAFLILKLISDCEFKIIRPNLNLLVNGAPLTDGRIMIGNYSGPGSGSNYEKNGSEKYTPLEIKLKDESVSDNSNGLTVLDIKEKRNNLKTNPKTRSHNNTWTTLKNSQTEENDERGAKVDKNGDLVDVSVEKELHLLATNYKKIPENDAPISSRRLYQNYTWDWNNFKLNHNEVSKTDEENKIYSGEALVTTGKEPNINFRRVFQNDAWTNLTLNYTKENEDNITLKNKNSNADVIIAHEKEHNILSNNDQIIDRIDDGKESSFEKKAVSEESQLITNKVEKLSDTDIKEEIRRALKDKKVLHIDENEKFSNYDTIESLNVADVDKLWEKSKVKTLSKQKGIYDVSQTNDKNQRIDKDENADDAMVMKIAKGLVGRIRSALKTAHKVGDHDHQLTNMYVPINENLQHSRLLPQEKSYNALRDGLDLIDMRL